MPKFAVYLHPHVCYTSKPPDQIRFVGRSYPHFSLVRQELEKALCDYHALPIRQADYNHYLAVHSRQYLDTLQRMAAGESVDVLPKLSIECAGLEYCLPGYLYGLGGMMEAIDQMKAGLLERAYCFSLGGHHAYADWGHGYCLLNPQAAAARYAQSQGFKRILVVDWDLHHGDGTQSIFANDPTVYCVSIHSAADLYMTSMRVIREGTTTRGQELGHCNLPLLDQLFDDGFWNQMNLPGNFYRAHESRCVFESALDHLLWLPNLILIFSGYDSHEDDCGAGITDWTNTDYEHLTRLVLDVAKKAACPVLSVNGGGYKLQVTVSAAASHVETLASY